MSRGESRLRPRGRPQPAEQEDVDVANRVLSRSRDDAPEPAERGDDVTHANRQMRRDLESNERAALGRKAATLNPPD